MVLPDLSRNQALAPALAYSMAADQGQDRDEPHSLGEVVDRLEDATRDDENNGDSEIRFGTIVEHFGRRAFAPLLLMPALFAILPTGAIPGIPFLLGLVLILVAGQLLVGLDRPWLPGRLLEVGFGSGKMEKTIAALRQTARVVDKLLSRRLTALIQPPMLQIGALMVILMALTMGPLEVIPFAVAIPGAAVALFALAVLARDGLLMILALLLDGVTLWLAITHLDELSAQFDKAWNWLSQLWA